MTLDELRTLVADSTASDWHRILKIGPTYRDRFGSWSSPADGARGILPLGGGHQGLRITQYELTVARLLSDIGDYREFDRYYSSVPFELQD